MSHRYDHCNKISLLLPSALNRFDSERSMTIKLHRTNGVGVAYVKCKYGEGNTADNYWGVLWQLHSLSNLHTLTMIFDSIVSAWQ